MADLVGGDLWTLDQELEKLSLYAAGREIGEQDVRLMVSQVREASIFEAVDAMIDGRSQVALRLLAQLRDDGREPQYIIAMVERQLRLLALAQDSIERRLPQNELKRALGTSSDFVVRKTMDQARRHSRRGHRLALRPPAGGRSVHQAGPRRCRLGPRTAGRRFSPAAVAEVSICRRQSGNRKKPNWQ